MRRVVRTLQMRMLYELHTWRCSALRSSGGCRWGRSAARVSASLDMAAAVKPVHQKSTNAGGWKGFAIRRGVIRWTPATSYLP